MDAQERWSDDPRLPAGPGNRPSSKILADRITENGLQLLYAARQDIAEHTASAPSSPLLDEAQLTMLDAIGVFRDIAAALNRPHGERSAELVAGHGRRCLEFERSRRAFLENQQRWQARRTEGR